MLVPIRPADIIQYGYDNSFVISHAKCFEMFNDTVPVFLCMSGGTHAKNS